MNIPSYQKMMLPLLKFAKDKKEHSISEAVDQIANKFNLSKEERTEILPSGQKTYLRNRVGWAKTYLQKACLLESTRRGHFKITERGLEVLEQNPSEIDVTFLKQFPEFIEFIARKYGGTLRPESEELDTQQTPEEVLESAYQTIQTDLAQELLATAKECSPKFFERLVVKLLVKMGYGGSRKDAGKAIGQTGDEGIDGLIKEDSLGLDVIYIQAKRWTKRPVGSPEIRDFVGALEGRKARKGIFITTSTFTDDARKFASQISAKVVLIDGNQLAQLMIEHDIGVSSVETYEVKKIDSDYFFEEIS